MGEVHMRAAARLVVRAGCEPFRPCRTGIEICQDPMRLYTMVWWKADLAAARDRTVGVGWWHFIDDTPPERAGHLGGRAAAAPSPSSKAGATVPNAKTRAWEAGDSR
ncbi:MAG: hypothetical protein HOQ24_10265 [Mycobacteriaceae bacterium]|nr:hypothetical protein [Mycobacteriaceae bacterium]